MMGTYSVYCTICRRLFVWFSGDRFQICELCMEDVHTESDGKKVSER